MMAGAAERLFSVMTTLAHALNVLTLHGAAVALDALRKHVDDTMVC